MWKEQLRAWCEEGIDCSNNSENKKNDKRAPETKEEISVAKQ